MPEENISTALGAFLHKRRLLLGKETISAFLRDMDIPFTDNYYRDIEAGRKKLSIEAAVQLPAQHPPKKDIVQLPKNFHDAQAPRLEVPSGNINDSSHSLCPPCVIGLSLSV